MARKPAITPPTALPLDVRLMNGVAGGIFALVALGLVAAAALWLTRAPMFTLRAIALDGELSRNSVNTVRANAMPLVRGNFFSIDLGRTRDAFQAVPWVRQAVVQRIWPNRLKVHIEEHHAAALWQGDDGNERIVNSFGEVFDANIGDVEDEALPQFAGPDGSSAQMLALYRRLQPTLARLDLEIDALHLSGRGSWRVELDNGATVELGRGSEDEVLARSERFVRTIGQVTGRYHQPLLYADLRHTDGYAVRLRGVSTATPAAKTIN